MVVDMVSDDCLRGFEVGVVSVSCRGVLQWI